MSLKKHAQTMETKWRLHAPEAFTSDVMEMALVDDKETEDTTDLRGRRVSTDEEKSTCEQKATTTSKQ